MRELRRYPKSPASPATTMSPATSSQRYPSVCSVRIPDHCTDRCPSSATYPTGCSCLYRGNVWWPRCLVLVRCWAFPAYPHRTTIFPGRRSFHSASWCAGHLGAPNILRARHPRRRPARQTRASSRSSAATFVRARERAPFRSRGEIRKLEACRRRSPKRRRTAAASQCQSS
jgi:hypothetical protein